MVIAVAQRSISRRKKDAKEKETNSTQKNEKKKKYGLLSEMYERKGEEYPLNLRGPPEKGTPPDHRITSRKRAR